MIKTQQERVSVAAAIRRLPTALLVLALIAPYATGQGSAGTAGGAEPRYLVDIPTAGMLRSGTFALDADFFQHGGMLLGINIGVINRFSLGISYGGSQLIGDEDADFNPVPGFNLRVRPFEEGISLPAIVIGFDSQGKEEFLDEEDRYTVRSKGFFVASSKNFDMAGFFSIHGGINYSLEGRKEDRGVEYFLGVEKTIGPIISAVLEYSSDHGKVSGGEGYLNFGVRLSPGGGFTIGLDLKDLTRNNDRVTIGNRSVKIEFLKPL